MIVRSKKNPNITLVIGSSSYQFKNGLCDIPSELLGSLSNDYEPIERVRKLKGISIVMLTYNALSYTKRAIKAIQENTKDLYELIIIDNASKDGTVEWLKSQNLNATFNKTNQGVAKGRNQGLKKAKYEIVCFLDNDTEVGPDWVDKIFTGLEDERVGIISKRGVKVLTLKPVQFAEPEMINGKLEADVGVGFCFACRRSLFEKIGDFYTKFPFPKFWHEDLEFGLRTKLAGFKVLIEDIPVIHHEHKSIGENIDNKKSLEMVKGFNENAAHVEELYRDDNVLTVYRDWAGYDASSSYDRYAQGLIPRLRDMGMIVIRRPSILTDCKSFDLCKGFEMKFNHKRIVILHQENNKCPKDWRVALEGVDLFFPASEHVSWACKDEPFSSKRLSSGIGGIESEVYNMEVKPLDLDDDFKFLMVSATQPRKNTLNLIKWFRETFTAEDKVRLIIKDGDYGQSSRTLDYIHETKGARIEYIFQKLTKEELARLYRAVAINGAYIHPHRAEALGLPILEAIACGCRVGTTGWGGPLYTTSGLKTVTLFDYDLKRSTFHNNEQERFYTEDPMWAEPREKDVKRFMKKIVKERYDGKEAKVSSELILKKYSYSNVAKKVFNILKSINGLQNV